MRTRSALGTGLALCILAAGCGGSGDGGGESTAADPVAGAAAWKKGSCEGCHAFREFPQGNVGPNLDNALEGETAASVRESIVRPQARIERNFSDLMPRNFGTLFTEQELDDLVAYLLLEP